jgi:hypothetical protein
MEENKQLQLLDVLGIPIRLNHYNNQNIIFAHNEKCLIYSLGSNIIHYNLKKDSKTFLQYFSSDISLLKFINNSENILLAITKSSFPILSIWQIPSFLGIYSEEIVTQDNFEVGDIFFEQINPINYLILITSKCNNSDNFLYSLNLLKNGKFNLNFFGKLKYIITKINGFNIFYNSNDIVFLMNHNIQYYTIDLKNEKCLLKKNINFSFKLKENSLRISKLNNVLCVLTVKGNCLIYDQNGNNKTTISPLGQECFTTCEFCDNTLCLGTSHGNIYAYNIYGFQLKYMINFNDISNIKYLSLINKNNIKYNNIINNKYITNNEIIFITLNEKLDQIFIIFNENSFAFMSLKQLLNKTKYNYNLKIIRINSTMFYSFNHSNKILDICMNPTEYNYRYNEIIFFSCSKDNKLIKYYLDQKTDKLQNQYYDLSFIISSSKQNNISANYLTVLQLHPVFNHKLFAGDKKGFLYIINLHINNIDSNNENIKYRKYNIGNFAIILLNFSKSGNLLCIGFETGHKLIYKTNKTFECILNLNEHYLKFEDIEFRKSNNHLLTFFSFLNNKRNKHCIIYTKNHNIIEYAKLFKNEDGYSLKKKKIMSMTIKNTILGLCIHKSENYVIILNERKQIVINNIIEKKTTALIDLNTQIRKIYNIQIDISGLYLIAICDMIKKNKNKNDKNKNDLIMIEINSSKVKNYIIHTSPISKAIFDELGKYIIIGGELGDISLWRLTGEISSTIKNFLGEVKNDVYFWDKYEINYNNHYKDDDFSIFLDDKDNYLSNNNKSSIFNDSSDYDKENSLSEEIINNNININKNKNFNTMNDIINKNELKNKKILNKIKIMNKKKYNDNRKLYNSNDYHNKKFFNENKTNDIRKNYFTENGLNIIRNKSQKLFKKNNEYNNQMMFYNKKRKNDGNVFKSIDKNNYHFKNNIFWTKRDTINIKKSLNLNEYKYPEPSDIDDYLI